MPSCKSCSSVFCSPLTAADDDDFFDFSHDDIFFRQYFRSLAYNDGDRALSHLGAGSTMTSPLLCDKPTYLLAEWIRYATSFSTSSNHRP